MNVDKHGRGTTVLIDTSQYYHGFVSGHSNSSVRAYLGNDQTISINIALDDNVYQVESLSRYEQTNSSILIYRLSDLKSNNTQKPLCPSHNLTKSFRQYSALRPKRSANSDDSISPIYSINDNPKKLCTLKLIADYRFHHEHGKGDKTRTHNYLIELIDNINELFQATEFVDANNNKYKGYGFLIQEIQVHDEWTVGITGHYNEERRQGSDAWKVEDLLNGFGEIDHSDVCLAHLFTYQSFSEGTLGLAWIGTSKSLGNGGICSERVGKSEIKNKSVNIAWSTYKDAAGNHLVSLSAYLVTAHELGHNWGADHDPDTPDCSPSDKGGGKFVMYTYSVIGYEKNNRIFSPCSKRSIGATIATRGEYCFKPIDNVGSTYCGNTRVDVNEECDLGRDNKGDSCCTPDCHFRPGAVCSPFNHECCSEKCQFKFRGEICAKADPLNPCLGNAICSGFSKECSSPKALTGPNCTEHGQCFNGKCRPYCEIINMEACICDKIEDACLICCRDKSTPLQVCRPASVLPVKDGAPKLILNDGRPCAQGFCKKGMCKRRVNKLVERIWKIIDELNPNMFAAFLLDNLVGTVIILSLLLWIPASIMVSCHDAKHRKKFLLERTKYRP